MDKRCRITYLAARHLKEFCSDALKARQLVSKHLKLSWLVVVSGLFLAGCKGGTLPVGTIKTGTPAGGILEATKVCDDYKAGESTADGQYKGKDLQVKGHILNVRPDPATKAKFVVLKGTEGSGSRNIRCYFTAEFHDKVEKLKSGDEVKVQGTCEGKMGGSGDSFDVQLKNCKLLN